MPLKILLDEDSLGGNLWAAIGSHNRQVPDEHIDAVRVGDGVGPPSGTKDQVLLDWSIKNLRMIVSQDRNTLIGLHQRVVDRGTVTPGLLMIRPNSSVQNIVLSLAMIVTYSDAEEWRCKGNYIPLH